LIFSLFLNSITLPIKFKKRAITLPMLHTQHLSYIHLLYTQKGVSYLNIREIMSVKHFGSLWLILITFQLLKKGIAHLWWGRGGGSRECQAAGGQSTEFEAVLAALARGVQSRVGLEVTRQDPVGRHVG